MQTPVDLGLRIWKANTVLAASAPGAGLPPVDHPAVPRALFDLLIGINRWLYRVLIYVALMRDEYPPFRLDQSGMSPTTWNLIARPRHQHWSVRRPEVLPRMS
jgi:hypothetical protein